MRLLKRLRSAWRLLRIREFAAAGGRCPFCGPTLFLRLNVDDGGIRCIRCTASTVHLSLGCVIREAVPNLSTLHVYELSASGPLVNFLGRIARKADFSEYSEKRERGSVSAGVRNEDAQRLTYPDGRFDLITHSEVMEHVPDDRAAFHELRRVLCDCGLMIFSVPLSAAATTVERARLSATHPEGVEHLLPPAYHSDPWQKGDGILAFRDYGADIVDRLNDAGFTNVVVQRPKMSIGWLELRHVIIARP